MKTSPSNETMAKNVIAVSTRLGWVSYFNDCASEVLARVLPLFLVTGLGVTPASIGLIEGGRFSVSSAFALAGTIALISWGLRRKSA
jgi:hypothetical protein